MAFSEFLGADHSTASNVTRHLEWFDFGTGAEHTPRRFFVWSGAPPSPAAPAAGVAIHGVSGVANAGGPPFDSARFGVYATRGRPFLVETGGAYSAGASLKTDANGKAIAQGGSGVIVATALETSGAAGEFRWAVFV